MSIAKERETLMMRAWAQVGMSDTLVLSDVVFLEDGVTPEIGAWVRLPTLDVELGDLQLPWDPQ